ncbi:MAG: GNAT family N-acetyltransferase [Chloroflexi bacterium]|nr:GNAT family N-acetyltransferase [Chloroflexota bacterium]
MANAIAKTKDKNKLIVYKYDYEIDDDFTADILAVDLAEYIDKNTAQKFKEYDKSYILALNDAQIIGYACFSFAGNDVFLHSIAVSYEFRRKGIGKNLLFRLFAFLSKKIQEGSQIKNVYAYAYTEIGEELLRDFNFTKTKDQQAGAPLMRCLLDDFKEANMYLFVPFFVNGELDTTDVVKLREDEDNSYLEELEHISGREFSSLSTDIKRGFIAKEKFIIVDEEDQRVLCNDKECKIYLTAYKNFYVATIAFIDLGFEPTIVIHQAAGNALYINADGEKLAFREYLTKHFGLKQSCEIRCVNMTGKARCFRQAYDTKCFTTLTAKPQEAHLAHMLACDCYGIGGTDETVTSAVFFEKARSNLEEHQFTQIYASEKSVVCVLTDSRKNRLLHEIRMIFVIELLSLQICAFSSNYDEIISGLDKREFSSQTIENVNFRFSRAAKLWDINNFRFLPAKNVFAALTKEFGILNLKAGFIENLNTFEKMTAMDSQKKVEQHSKSSRIILTFFSVMAGIIALSSLVNLFYQAIAGESDESAVILTICGIAVALLASVSIFWTMRNKKRLAQEKEAQCKFKKCKHNTKQ